jgi:hypothetical protein
MIHHTVPGISTNPAACYQFCLFGLFPLCLSALGPRGGIAREYAAKPSPGVAGLEAPGETMFAKILHRPALAIVISVFILFHRTLKDALVIPQRATFDLLDKKFVWVVGEDDVAHQRLITIKHELEDIFVIDSGLDVGDRLVLEGIRQVQDGGKVEYSFRSPEDALKHQKFHAE